MTTQLVNLAVNPLDAKALIGQAGTVGLLAIVFAETGLLIGFFLPGDSLLILAGVAASGAGKALLGTQMSIGTLLVATPLCAIAGAQLGHLIGAKVGPRLFDRPNSRLFKRDHVVKAEAYFNRFGPAKAVVMARFIPVVRTFLNPVAGTLEMPARTFFVWNAVGGLIWTEVMLLIGWKFGSSMAPVIDKYLIPAVLVIVLLSVIPILIEVLRGRREGVAGGEGGQVVAEAFAGADAPGAPSASSASSASSAPVAAGGRGRHRKR